MGFGGEVRREGGEEERGERTVGLRGGGMAPRESAVIQGQCVHNVHRVHVPTYMFLQIHDPLASPSVSISASLLRPPSLFPVSLSVSRSVSLPLGFFLPLFLSHLVSPKGP